MEATLQELNFTPSNSAEELIKDGWFGEKEVMWPGQKFSLKVTNLLVNGRSQFQDFIVFDSETFGRVLVLDGVVQYTERDEFSYQEMITHIPCFAHGAPKSVLIIGGGDGGVLREVLKHPSVERVDKCEIDVGVVNVAKKFFPTNAAAFNDPRFTLIVDDAAKYLQYTTQKYDVIISDSSDPVGPAETLFSSSFFESLRNVLNPGGVICTQAECLWIDLDLIEKLVKDTKALFPVVKYAFTTIPTYPSGQIGFLVLSNDASVDPTVASRPAPSEWNLKYYSDRVHSAAFVLPEFARKQLNL